MIALDTSFLVAFFNDDDALHPNAIKDMKDIEKEPQIISDYVALETATVLKHKTTLKIAAEFLEFIRNKNNLHIRTYDKSDFERIENLFKNQRHSIGFIDASVVYLTITTNSNVATYDENILKEIKLLRR